MVRIVACIIVATFLSTGSGCVFLKQSNSVTTVISAPTHETGNNEDAGELLEGGEADPSRMTLTMKNWTWIQTVYNNNTTVTPAKPDVFTLTFNEDGRLNATTDCNRMNGSYSIDGRLLSFSKLAATRMYCPDSQESKFADMLSHVAAFLFTSKGELVLELKFDSGQMLFK